jgi:hypothetical protein
VGRRSELCSKLLSVALMKDSVNFANRRHDHAWSTVKGSRSPPWPFVAPRAHTVLALVRPAVWDRTARVGACNCRPGARRSPRRQVASWQCGSAGRGCLRVGKWCDIGRGQPHQYLKRRDGHHKKRLECSALPGTSPTHRYDRTCLHLVCAPRASRRDELAALSLQAERWFSAAERETQTETFAHA